MANIFDYLTWRGDVPFSVDPFNEVDNLVLSELAYTDFDGIVPQGGAAVSLQTVCDAFFARHTEEELLSLRDYTAKAPLLLRGMLSGERFRDAKLSWYVNEISKDQALQLSAVTVLLPNRTAFVAFRGTDGTVVGWKEDFNFSFQSQTEGQGRAVAYLNRVGKALACPLYIGGHSKGGNLAVFAAVKASESVRGRILAVYNNDGPGGDRGKAGVSSDPAQGHPHRAGYLGDRHADDQQKHAHGGKKRGQRHCPARRVFLAGTAEPL